MSYIVTALKWRPQKFSEVVGQSHITQTLKNSIKNGRIAHAYIFAGPRGVGKTTTARILAKRLNCLNPQEGEPCNECEMCRAIQSGQTMDVIEIDGASNRRIDEIRQLRESVRYAPTAGKYKVYIIDEVHMLTTESFNALLKTLEEPPEHTIFIFATTDIHKVPLTIISRCQRFDFRRIELNEIKGLLSKIAKAESIEIDDESLTIIAKKADGALRDAQSLFDQVASYCGSKITSDEVRKMLNLIDEDIFFGISEAVLKNDFRVAYETVQKLYENGWNFIDFVMGLIEHFRNIMAISVTGSAKYLEASEMSKLKYESLKASFSEADLLRILTFLTKLLAEVKIAQNQRLSVEIGLSKLIGLERSATITELIDILKNKETLPTKSNSTPQQTEVKKKAPIENNISPVKEETIKKETEKPRIEINSIDDLKLHWKEFIAEVNRQKFSVGSFLINSSPLSFSNSHLVIQLAKKEGLEIVNFNIRFLTEAFKNYFGKKVTIEIKAIESEEKKPQENSFTNNAPKNSSEDNPLIKAIIEKLGGKEIK